MKFPISALLFLILSFIFFIVWAVSTLLIDTVYNAMSPLGSMLSVGDNSNYQALISQIPLAFGVICVLFFVVGIILIFVLESWSDEPEYYWRQ